METFRVATMNFAGGMMKESFPERLQLLHQWLFDGHDSFSPVLPDVLLLQEVGNANQAHRISEKLGMPCEHTPDEAHLEGRNTAVFVQPHHRFTGVERVTFPKIRHFPGAVGGDGPEVTVAHVELSLPHVTLPITALSSHLAWGTFGVERMKQVTAVDSWVRETLDVTFSDYGKPERPIIWGGDFNALPNDACMRWLRGETVLCEHEQDMYKVHADGRDIRRYTLWTDTIMSVLGEHPTTSDPRNKLSLKAAQIVGMEHPEILPSRCIDYLLVNDYPWGHPGAPLAGGVWGDIPGWEPSDHYGLWAELYAGQAGTP